VAGVGGDDKGARPFAGCRLRSIANGGTKSLKLLICVREGEVREVAKTGREQSQQTSVLFNQLVGAAKHLRGMLTPSTSQL
jgi:hypothetical protein